MAKKILLFILCWSSILFSSERYVKPALITAAAIVATYAAYKGYVYYHAIKNPGTPIRFNEKVDSDVITIFAHGIADTHAQVNNYVDLGIIKGRGYTFNFPDATQSIFRVNHAQSSLAQESEIECLKNVIEHAALEKKPIILYGLSRGASTIINLLATYSNPYIKAIVLESPFDSMQTVTNNMIKQMGIERVPGIRKLTNYLVEKIFGNYKTDGVHPINCCTQLPTHIPTLIICSKEDALVPYQSSVAIYNELIKSHHSKVRLLITEHGKHGKIIHGPDSEQVRKTVKQFYGHYKKI